MVKVVLRSTDAPDQRADAIMALLSYIGDPQQIAEIRGLLAAALKHYAELDRQAAGDAIPAPSKAQLMAGK